MQYIRKGFEYMADGNSMTIEFMNMLENKIATAPFTYRVTNQQIIPVPIGEVNDIMMSLISFDILRLFEENKLKFLKHCTNPECVLLFIDEGGRRKWCSMKICGNRRKVSRYQQRRN